MLEEAYPGPVSRASGFPGRGMWGTTDANVPYGGIVKPMSQAMEQLTYSVPGMSCGQCRAAITAEVERVQGVTGVEVDVDAKRVRVTGERLDDDAVRAAIDEAGYDVA